MPAGYYRFPTIHADRVVFAAEDDLWTVPAAGGLARRLTSGVGEATRPWLSPDGEWLAFTSSEEGPPEIFVMPAEGGASQRLTYLGGGSTLVAGWTADGRILFTSNAHHWYLRYHQVYSIDRLGQDLRLLDVGLAHAISADPAGGVVLARNPADPARWKRYRGGTAGQLWIDPDGSGEYRPLIRTGGNLASPQWVGGRIYFISDHEGVGNLYSCLPDGSDLQRHTHHADFYARNLAADSARLVYHAGADLYLFNPATGAGGKIEVQFNSPQTQRKRKFVFAARYLEGARLHPKGHSLAVTVRGQLFSFANWEGAVTQYAPVSESQPAEPATAVRLRRPTWLNDGKRLLAVSDEGGEENLALIQADSGAYERLEGLDIGRVTSMRANPRKNQAAITNHRLELAVIDLDTRQLRLVDRGAARPIEGFDWSPDGEWLVYSRSLTNNVSQLRLWQAATGEIHNLTGEEFRDVYPHFDPSGRSILFLSYRQFEPVMDHLHFDLGFPRGMRPCLITLQQDLPNPFIPRLRLEEDKKPGDPPAEPAPAAQPGAEDGNPAEDRPAEAEPVEKAEPAKPAPAGEKLPPPVKIDLEGIQQRILAFPVAVGRYGGIFATRDGKTLYTRAPGDTPLADELAADELPTRYTLYTYSFEEQKEEVYLGGVSYFELTPDGSFILIRAGNGLRVLRAGEKADERANNSASRKSGWIDLGRLRVSVSPGAEWRQMFREAWRLQRDQFWTPDMSQVDWVAVHDRYLPLVERVSSRAEFSDLMWEMQGELGTSHAYELGGDYRPGPAYYIGKLGAQFAFDPAAGAWRLTDLVIGDPWEAPATSPLAGPGVNLQAGDLLLAVNGRRLSATVSPETALVNLAGQEVALVVKSGEGEPRQVNLRTLNSETTARYRAWVNANRRRVHEATGGRIGYLHIPDMGPAGYAEFHRGYLAEVNRDGLIVDLRYNRGGFVSALLIEKLARRRLGYDKTRWAEALSPYPPESTAGPVVALVNEFTGSDGDIFSHAFKMLGLGPLIGTRTWGGVVGYNPNQTLVDGTLTTQPEYSFWFQDIGWGIENYGVDPDIPVEIPPQAYRAGADPQMERAIEEILTRLQANPPQRPDFSNRPNLALPRLPEK